MTVADYITKYQQLLSSVGIQSALLDVEILIASAINKNRTWLHAHRDEMLNKSQVAILEELIKRRLNREPIAYIVGHKEFYGREFTVTPDTLIPRPETEDVIELALKTMKKINRPRLLDVGCGSGCIGITLKLEMPSSDITLCDISPAALKIAQENAENLEADVMLTRSDLLESVHGRYDIIVANLPYVDKAWERSPETNHEPEQALFAENGGLKLIHQLIAQSPQHLHSGGNLILEADPVQHKSCIAIGAIYGFTLIAQKGYAFCLQLTESQL